MGKKIDMTGWVMKEHGILDSKLTVLYEDKEYVKNRKTLVGPYWLCKCECGNITTVLGQSLRKGNTKSCGCLKKENTAAKDLTNKKFGKLIAINQQKNVLLMGVLFGNVYVLVAFPLLQVHMI